MYRSKTELELENKLLLLQKKEWYETFKTIYGNARKLAAEHNKLKETIIFLNKNIQSKVKLIEELKKKCKTSIKNSLSKNNKTRNSKTRFSPSLYTIPNTKRQTTLRLLSRIPTLSKSRKSNEHN
jgi:hypothetical protein